MDKIYLKDKIKSISLLKNTSKRLGKLQAKLDCSDVDSLTEAQLDAIFSRIPSEYIDINEYGSYIDDDTITSNRLQSQINNWIDRYKASKLASNNKKQLVKFYTLLTVSLILLIMSIIGIYYLVKPKVHAKTIKIGILTSIDSYLPLASYLRSALVSDDFFSFLKGEQIKIIVEGDRELSYQEAKNRITNKEWDIAFTLSPVISATAKENGYLFSSRMFPGKPKNYQSAIFVKADSKISSIDDIKTNNTIALGDFNSASSFYMPIYELYGKTLSINMKNRGQDILKMVKSGKVDLGAAAYGDTVSNQDHDIRVILLSRNIPGSGVYLSPHLNGQDRQTITKVLKEASADIKKLANYDVGDEADYSSFLKISKTTEEIIWCVDFNQNPVFLSCKGNKIKNIIKPSSDSIIVGLINGYRYLKNNDIALSVSGNDNLLYRIIIPSRLSYNVFGRNKSQTPQNKKIRFVVQNLKKSNNGNLEINLSAREQFKIY